MITAPRQTAIAVLQKFAKVKVNAKDRKPYIQLHKQSVLRKNTTRENVKSITEDFQQVVISFSLQDKLT